MQHTLAESAAAASQPPTATFTSAIGAGFTLPAERVGAEFSLPERRNGAGFALPEILDDSGWKSLDVVGARDGTPDAECIAEARSLPADGRLTLSDEFDEELRSFLSDVELKLPDERDDVLRSPLFFCLSESSTFGAFTTSSSSESRQIISGVCFELELLTLGCGDSWLNC